MESGIPEPKSIVATTTKQKVAFTGTTVGLDCVNLGLDNTLLLGFDGYNFPLRVKPDEQKFFPAKVTSLWVKTETGSTEVLITGYIR